MIIGITCEQDMREGMELIAENMELKRRLEETELRLARLQRLNLVLNAEVEMARREKEERRRAEEERREAELDDIVRRHTEMMQRSKEFHAQLRRSVYGERPRAGSRREWR